MTKQELLDALYGIEIYIAIYIINNKTLLFPYYAVIIYIYIYIIS